MAEPSAGTVILHMVRSGLLLGAVFGVIQIPLHVVLLAILSIATGSQGEAQELASMVCMIAPITMFVGAVIGGIIGLFGGLATGVVIAAMFALTNGQLLYNESRRNLLALATALAIGLVVLALTYFLIGSSFDWLLWAVIPSLIAGAATWWTVQRLYTDLNSHKGVLRTNG